MDRPTFLPLLILQYGTNTSPYISDLLCLLVPVVVPNNDFAQGKVLKVNECRGGHDQQFRYNENTRQLSAGHNNLCIQILHPFDGSPISLYPCDSNKAEQKWDFLGDGRIYNQRYNKCGEYIHISIVDKDTSFQPSIPGLI